MINAQSHTENAGNTQITVAYDMSNNLKAVLALLTAVLALSLLPLNLELTAKDSNPFVFVAIQTAAMTVSLGLYLFITAPKRFNTRRLRDITGPPRNLLVNSHTGQPHHHKNAIASIFHTIATWLRTPLLWAVLVGLEYSLLAWSLTYIDAAVATIIYGVWPMVTIYAMIYLSKGIEGSQYHIYFQKKVLTVLALVGLIVVVVGSIEDDQSLISNDSGSMWLTAGAMSIAMLAAILNGINPAMSIHFSDLMHQRTAYAGLQDKKLVAQQKLWLSVYAVTAGRLISMPVNLGLGFLVSRSSALETQALEITPRGAVAAVISGMTLLAAASILLRLANLNISDLSANSICYAEPALTFLWLILFANPEIPNFNLFIVGAVIVIASNVLIQVIPDINLGSKPNEKQKPLKPL